MASSVPDTPSPHDPAYIQDQLQSPWGQVDTHVAEHGPSHLAHQVAGLGQQGQQDLHQHLHPWWLLGGCRRERLSQVRGDVPTRPSPGGNDLLAALERVRRGFSPRLFWMQVWMSASSSQLSAGDWGRARTGSGQAPLPAPLSPSQPGLSTPGTHSAPNRPQWGLGAR